MNAKPKSNVADRDTEELEVGGSLILDEDEAMRDGGGERGAYTQDPETNELTAIAKLSSSTERLHFVRTAPLVDILAESSKK
jgi:hypothetical protein